MDAVFFRKALDDSAIMEYVQDDVEWFDVVKQLCEEMRHNPQFHEGILMWAPAGGQLLNFGFSDNGCFIIVDYDYNGYDVHLDLSFNGDIEFWASKEIDEYIGLEIHNNQIEDEYIDNIDFAIKSSSGIPSEMVKEMFLDILKDKKQSLNFSPNNE